MNIEIHTLWGVRKDFDETPELMVAWDEFTREANWEGFDEACEREKALWGNDLADTRLIVIKVPYESIQKAFEAPTIEGEA